MKMRKVTQKEAIGWAIHVMLCRYRVWAEGNPDDTDKELIIARLNALRRFVKKNYITLLDELDYIVDMAG